MQAGLVQRLGVQMTDENKIEEIKELAATNCLLDAYLILAECRKLKTSLALEHQVAQRDRKAQDREFRSLWNELRTTLDVIQAQFAVERGLLDLIQPETGRQNNERRTQIHSQ